MVKIIQAIQPEWILPGGKQTSISLYQHRSVFWNIISELQLVTQKHFAPLFADFSDWQQEMRASSRGAVCLRLLLNNQKCNSYSIKAVVAFWAVITVKLCSARTNTHLTLFDQLCLQLQSSSKKLNSSGSQSSCSIRCFFSSTWYKTCGSRLVFCADCSFNASAPMCIRTPCFKTLICRKFW